MPIIGLSLDCNEESCLPISSRLFGCNEESCLPIFGLFFIAMKNLGPTVVFQFWYHYCLEQRKKSHTIGFERHKCSKNEEKTYTGHTNTHHT